MSNQVQLPGVGMISLAVFIVVFVLLMLVGYSFLAALVFALAVAIAVAIFFLLLRDRRRDVAVTGAGAAPSARAAETMAAPFVSSPPAPQPPRPDPAPVVEPRAATGSRVEPLRLDAPRGGRADDLKRIKGVGPKLEGALHGMGIYHLDQIASWGPGEVAWMDENLVDFHGRVSRDDWVSQARLLAGGGETEFSRRVDKGEVYD